MQGVRWREDTGFEGKCDYCLDYWPLTMEFWESNSFRKCKACIREHTKHRIAELRKDPEIRARYAAAATENRKAKREMYLEYQRGWYRANSERERAKRRARYLAKLEAEGKTLQPRLTDDERRERGKAQDRAYYERNRDRIRAAQKERTRRRQTEWMRQYRARQRENDAAA